LIKLKISVENVAPSGALQPEVENNSKKIKQNSKSSSTRAGGPSPEESGFKPASLTGCKL